MKYVIVIVWNNGIMRWWWYQGSTLSSFTSLTGPKYVPECSTSSYKWYQQQPSKLAAAQLLYLKVSNSSEQEYSFPETIPEADLS